MTNRTNGSRAGRAMEALCEHNRSVWDSAHRDVWRSEPVARRQPVLRLRKEGLLASHGYAISSSVLARHDNEKRYPSVSLIGGCRGSIYFALLATSEHALRRRRRCEFRLQHGIQRLRLRRKGVSARSGAAFAQAQGSSASANESSCAAMRRAHARRRHVRTTLLRWPG